MKRRVAFIGHKDYLPNGIKERVYNAVVQQINLGCIDFVMGTHGDFDQVALSVCKELKKRYQNIDFEVAITSLKQISPEVLTDEFGVYKDYPYEGIKTIMYEIEECHFKRRIIESNRQMIDSADTLICYVNENRLSSGAKMAMKYAVKQGLNVINLHMDGEF